MLRDDNLTSDLKCVIINVTNNKKGGFKMVQLKATQVSGDWSGDWDTEAWVTLDSNRHQDLVKKIVKNAGYIAFSDVNMYPLHNELTFYFKRGDLVRVYSKIRTFTTDAVVFKMPFIYKEVSEIERPWFLELLKNSTETYVVDQVLATMHPIMEVHYRDVTFTFLDPDLNDVNDEINLWSFQLRKPFRINGYDVVLNVNNELLCHGRWILNEIWDRLSENEKDDRVTSKKSIGQHIEKELRRKQGIYLQ